MATMKRWHKWSIAFSVLVLLLGTIMLTAVGNRALLGVLNWSVNGLTVELHEGTIIGGGRMSVDYQDEQTAVELNDLRIKAQWFGCSGFCVDVSGSSANIELNSQASKTTDKPLATDQKPLKAPIGFERLNLHFGKIALTIDKTQVEVNNLALSGGWLARKIELEKVSIDNIKLRLPQDEANAGANTPNEKLRALPAIAELPIVVPLDLTLKQLQVKSLAINQGAEQKNLADIALQAQLTPKRIRWQGLSVKYQQFGLISAGSLQQSKAKRKHWQIETQSTLTTPDQHLALSAKGWLGQLSLTAQLKGQAGGELAVKVNLTEQNWPFELAGHVEQVPLAPWLETKLDALALQHLALQGEGSADDYRFDLSAGLYSEQTQKVEVDGKLSGSLKGLNLKQAHVLNGPTKVSLQASADWQQALVASAKANIAKLPLSWFISPQQAPIDLAETIDADIEVSAAADGEHWAIGIPKLNVRGQLQGKPVLADAKLSLNEQLYGEVEQLVLSLGDSQVVLSGKLADELDLQGEVNINHSPDTLLPLRLAMQGELKLSGSRTAPKVWLDADIPAVVHSEGELHQGKVELTLNGQNDWAGQLSLGAKRMIYQGQQLNDVAVLFIGSRAEHQLDVVSSGAIAAAISAKGSWLNEQWQGRLEQASFDFTQHPSLILPTLTLKAPLVIRAGVDHWRLSDHCWQVASSELCIDAEQNSGKGSPNGLAHVKVASLNLKDLEPWLTQAAQLSGKAKGVLSFSWAQGRLNAIKGELSTAGVELTSELEGERTTLPLEQLSVQLNSDKANAQLDWQLQSSLIGALNGQLHMPMTGDELVPRGEVNVVDMQLKPLAPLLSKLLKQRLSIEGQVAGQLQLTQLARSPVVHGTLGVSQLTLEGALLPVALKSSEAQLNFHGQGMRLTSQLFGRKGGELSVAGEFDWQQELSAKVALNGKDFLLTPEPNIKLTVSPDIEVSYHDSRADIRGQLSVPFGRIEVEQLPKGLVHRSDDQIIVDEPIRTVSRSPVDYKLSLTVSVKDDFRVKAMGLDSYITGQIDLSKQPAKALLASGELSLREGTYKAFGQDLQIKTGQIGFNGPLDKPYINIRAIRNPLVTADEVIAGVELSGSIAKPDLTIYSQPAMEQAKALAYLLYGQPLGEGEDSDSNVLTTLLLTQSIEQSKGVVSKIGEKLGFSDVSISAKGSGDNTKVEVSGYLSPSFQVSYRVGVFESLSEIAIRYRVFGKLYIEATSGLYDSIDLLYKFDWGD